MSPEKLPGTDPHDSPEAEAEVTRVRTPKEIHDAGLYTKEETKSDD